MANRESNPPPPYSETDTGSTFPPSTSQTDGSSLAGRGSGYGDGDGNPYPRMTPTPGSSTESVSSVVYTPGASPEPSEYPPGWPGWEFYHDPDATDGHTPGASPKPSEYPRGWEFYHDLDATDGFDGSDGFSSASGYFDSRPLRWWGLSISREGVRNYEIVVQDGSVPDDLPYPKGFQERDVTELDWKTFLNYLLPWHTRDSNREVFDRKIRAEGLEGEFEAMRLCEKGDKGELGLVVKQLESLRVQDGVVSLNRKGIMRTVEEWNERFFGLRGIYIVLNPNTDTDTKTPPTSTQDENYGATTPQTTRTREMPGTWIPYDHELFPPSILAESASKGKGVRRGMLSGFKGFSGVEAGSRGFRIGRGLFADNNGLRLGNILRADNKGFRLGGSRGLVADLSMGGRRFGPYNEPLIRTRVRGSRGRQCHRHPHSLNQNQDRNPRRSLSSTSSSSHASSIDSVSSIGSLPGYEELEERQLGSAKVAIGRWLEHPEWPVSKESVSWIRREIEQAGTFSFSSSSLDHLRHEQQRQDITVLRIEVRDLMRIFKERIRAEKRERRVRKHEKRTARRIAKRERRITRREERRFRRDVGFAERRRGIGAGHGQGLAPNYGLSMPVLPSNIRRGFPFSRTTSAPQPLTINTNSPFSPFSQQQNPFQFPSHILASMEGASGSERERYFGEAMGLEEAARFIREYRRLGGGEGGGERGYQSVGLGGAW